MHVRTAALIASLVCSLAAAAPKPAPVAEYSIHADGGIVYDPLHREAVKTGQLQKYDHVPTTEHTVQLGDRQLSFRVPERADAYDVIPITYEVSNPKSKTGNPKSQIVAVEATAFEDAARRNNRDLFDLNLPGRIDMDFEYLGSVTAHLRPGGRHNLEPDMSDQPAVYPPFDRKPLVRSGAIEAGDVVWFRIKYTNTGNTILDPEGFSGTLFYPVLLRKNAAGNYEHAGNHYNLYIRDLEYMYPGESRETWVNFQTFKQNTPEGMGLVPGEYMLRMRLIYRGYKTPDVFLNIWDGPEAVVWDLPFTVEKEAREVPVASGKKTLIDGGNPDKLTRFIHTFEEFMAAFDCWQSPSVDGEAASGAGDADQNTAGAGRRSAVAEIPSRTSSSRESLPANNRESDAARVEGRTRGTLHLQVAPWTQHIVVKLITNEPMSIATAAVPIQIGSDTLRFRPDLDPTEYIVRNGRREPVFVSQTMADMRSNIQLGPEPERHIRTRLREMLDCGVNVVSTTSMPWLYDDMRKPASNYNGDAMKYFMDLARREGMMVEGWGTYPFDRATIQDIAAWLSGKPWKMDRYATDGYEAVSHADPLLPQANAIAWLYQFHRWGDLYYQSPTGVVPFSVEDTRGWLRQDEGTRFPMGDRSIAAFRDWIRDKYKTVDAANTAWGTSFKSFEEINPEAGQITNQFGHRWEFTDRSNPFHDWNDAIADFDAFRTDMRIKNYRETLELLRKEVPDAIVVLRTEGANAVVAGLDPADPDAHIRHAYYSQRRCALVAEQVQRAGIFKYHSDYITLPYTPSELRQLISAAVHQGIVTSWLPQIDNMRDIAVNTRYGNDYQTQFNLPEPRMGYMMHVLAAGYPWWQATIESGGVPGVLWADYQCDGFVTETQKRELRLFTARLRESLADWSRQPAPIPSQNWRHRSLARPSYRLD